MKPGIPFMLFINIVGSSLVRAAMSGSSDTIAVSITISVDLVFVSGS